jgi:hypothetical protein
MSVKSIGRELAPVAFPLGVCLGALLLNARAWHVGRDAPGHGLMPLYLGCLFLLLLAWLSVLLLFRAVTEKEKPSGLTVADVIVLFLTMPACAGCYGLWPFVLLVWAFLFLAVALFAGRKDANSRDWPLTRRAGLTAVLFLLTWYHCATAKRQALHGFADRIEATVREDRLLDWAAEVMAGRKAGKDSDASGHFLERDEIPAFVHDLMGGVPQRTRVVVHVKGAGPHVSIATSAQESLRITVRPSRAPHQRGPFPPPWVFQESAGLPWRPGIYLDTLGNFR